ncbi:MAG: hypothetical protein IJM30_04385 [Thermoguttaceae bacterium]|nr:hypothetical protein [Thermoguttaceae bacterium]
MTKEELDALEPTTPGLNAMRKLLGELTVKERKELQDAIDDFEARMADREEYGYDKGKLETLFGLVRDGDLTLTKAAKRAQMTVPQFKKATAALALA